MSKYFLTICIPTYNRADVLDFLLNELFNQIEFNNFSDVKIAVSDNSTNDDTGKLILSKEKYRKIVYNKNKENLGAFGNLMKVTSMVTSEFVWVLGDDDFVTPNAIKNIYQELQNCNADIDFIFLNSCGFDSTLSYISSSNESPHLKTHLYSKKSMKLFSDFSFSSLGHFSRLVFRQKAWLDNNPIHQREPFEIYPQIKSILKIASNNPVLFLDKIIIINSRRAINASASWSGYGSIYWAYEYLSLLNIASETYGYNKTIKNQKYYYTRKIVLSYLKMNVQKETYAKILFKIKKELSNSLFYFVFMKPIEIMCLSSFSRLLIKKIGSKLGVTFHNIQLDTNQ